MTGVNIIPNKGHTGWGERGKKNQASKILDKGTEKNIQNPDIINAPE